MSATFLTAPIPHDEAIGVIAGAAPVTRDIFDALLPEFTSRAFTVTGVEALEPLRRIRDIVAQLPAGGDWDDLKTEILDELSPWLITATDPEERASQLRSAARRAELILRNNGWAGYAVANHRAMASVQEDFPYAMYLSSEDERVRKTHAALNKKILPAAHPFWETHTPPWEHGCRCDKVPMTENEVGEIRQAEQSLPLENRRVLEGPPLEAIERGQLLTPNATGALDIRTPREKNGSGYEFRPGTLDLSYEDILARHDAASAAAFQAWAETIPLEDGRTLDVHLGRRRPPGTPPPILPAAPAPAPTLPTLPVLTLAEITDALLALAPEADAAEAVRLPAYRAWLRASNNDAEDTRAAYLAAAAAADAIAARARALVEIPAGERGKVTLTPATKTTRRGKTTTTSRPVMARAAQGAAIVEAFTHPDLMPKVTVAATTGREKHTNGTIHIGSKTFASTVAHEITHATERQTPEVLAAALAFLAKRAGKDPTVSLRRATGITRYGIDERAWEDEWVAKGGHLYAGKDYKGRATELLTMGIERLHRDPIEFAKNDPEYFQFVLSTLQKR